MILTVKNFKCFFNGKFEFEDDTNYLISAPSGYGKTSLFEAIKFVLWGNRDVDVITFGKKKCEVSLEYKGFLFKRTKNPNFFSIVSTKLGTIENPTDFVNLHFPKYHQKFISLSSSKQMEILNTISSNNKDIQTYKDKIKNLISEGNLELKKNKNLLELYEKTLENLPLFSENIVKPEKNNLYENDIENSLKISKQHYEEMRSSNKYFDSLQQELNFIKKENNEDETKLNINKEKNLKELIVKISEYDTNKKRLCELKTIDLNLDIDKLNKEITEQKELIEDLNFKHIHDCKIKEQISEIAKKIKMFKIPKSFEQIESILANTHNTGNSDDLLVCPECNTNLFIENGLLKIKENKTDIEFLNKINNLYKTLYFKDSENKSYELKNQKIVLEKLQKKKEEYLEYLKLNESISLIDIEKIKNKTKLLEKIIYRENRIKELEKKINTVKKYPDVDIENKRKELLDYEHKLQEIKDYTKDLLMWENNEKIKKTRNEYINKIIETKSNIESNLNVLENMEILKKIIDESHTLSLSSLIKIINKKLSFFCEKFFTEEISVKIKEFKYVNSTKTNKPQLDIIINYKGTHMKINNLSSGEYARVELMMDLVLYDITNNNSPLLLDEVTANLDSDSSSNILKIINTYFQNKNIFVIAHQAIEGGFTNVITEENLDKKCHRV